MRAEPANSYNNSAHLIQQFSSGGGGGGGRWEAQLLTGHCR